ncbi:YrbL family protein [Mangrovicella endophytica]|uniref:YrbL family protein n=1 Tax=Mangrovicella endophytica TaxID=2066697 RepID=UPI000C9E8B94|nr:YrbL family protein [Mangrovicella endophytica]
MIILKGRQPAASGGINDVYLHPNDDSLLIKVTRDHAVARAAKKSAFFYGPERRYRHLKNFLRPLREQVALRAATGCGSAHLETLIGLTETDLGIGLIVKAETRDGRLAPTLDGLLKSSTFDAAMREELDRFCAWVVESPIVLNDLRARNLVYVDDPSGGGRFVMIDGYGETGAIPMKSWLGWLNRRSKRRDVARLLERVDAVLAKAAQPPATLQRDRRAPSYRLPTMSAGGIGSASR